MLKRFAYSEKNIYLCKQYTYINMSVCAFCAHYYLYKRQT